MFQLRDLKRASDRGVLLRVVIELQPELNIDVLYETGIVEDGRFIPDGTDTLHLEGQRAVAFIASLDGSRNVREAMHAALVAERGA